MELMSLHRTTYKPNEIIREFKDLIWTERHVESGDFKIVAEDDFSILDLLPTGSLISHSDTDEVMIVEDHDIERNADKTLIVTVTGRSFETFLENRVVAPYQSTNVPYPLYTLNPTTLEVEEVTYILDDPFPPNIIATLISNFAIVGVLNPEDAIPNLAVSLDVSPFPTMTAPIAIKRGSLYERVLDLIKAAGYGIRTERPKGAETNLTVVIYSGDYLVDSVKFTAQNQDFTDAKYFKTTKQSKESALVVGYSRVVNVPHYPSGYTGLDRKTLYVEDREEYNDTVTHIDNILYEKGLGPLYQSRELDLIQCRISESAEPKYKLDYNIGDIVTVVGEFGKVQQMRVTEYILTTDAQGTRGYPTLAAI